MATASESVGGTTHHGDTRFVDHAAPLLERLYRRALRMTRNRADYEDLLQGLNRNEIALAMGTPLGTVMSRLHRGRRQLRRILTDVALPA